MGRETGWPIRLCDTWRSADESQALWGGVAGSRAEGRSEDGVVVIRVSTVRTGSSDC